MITQKRDVNDAVTKIRYDSAYQSTGLTQSLQFRIKANKIITKAFNISSLMPDFEFTFFKIFAKPVPDDDVVGFYSSLLQSSGNGFNKFLIG